METPCINICLLDDKSGLCVGCGRSGEEIAGWVDMRPPTGVPSWLSWPSAWSSWSVRQKRKAHARDHLACPVHSRPRRHDAGERR
ncbi:DUF1289 domain-containing protein [Methyloceanibacter superfactus]|uniref:DUF1289 domain-containing protein n=1 Tax=Methyloceanibacter superfactus TaxID=1774969 RepID=UPI001FCDC886|nr:DUF1289 domain-containing protein [Methyloceanibacter superfactus]